MGGKNVVYVDRGLSKRTHARIYSWILMMAKNWQILFIKFFLLDSCKWRIFWQPQLLFIIFFQRSSKMNKRNKYKSNHNVRAWVLAMHWRMFAYKWHLMCGGPNIDQPLSPSLLTSHLISIDFEVCFSIVCQVWIHI